MKLSVKVRIAIAMTLVLTVNVAAGAVSWALNARAAQYAEASREASDRARWVGGLSGLVTTFVSEANDLAFGVGSDLSAEGSAEYGDVMGVDGEIDHWVRTPEPGLDPDELEQIETAWSELRIAVFVWVNAEAVEAGSPTRLTLTDDGRVRASVDTNIEAPVALASLGTGELRREVRSEAEAFGDGLLRGIERSAQEEMAAALVGEQQARDLATVVTLVLIAASILMAAGAAVWLYRTIASPLNRARAVADAVASGDLDAAFGRHSEDEIGSLIHAVEAMRDAVVTRITMMREMAGAVLVTADGVAEAVLEAGDHVGDDAAPELLGALDDVGERTRVLGSLAGQMLDS